MRNISIFSAEYAAKIQPFISTEQTRYYLNGFLLEQGSAGAVMVATNGHIMGIFNDETAVVAKAGDVVQLSKDFLKACKAKSHFHVSVFLDHDNKTAYLAATTAKDEALPDDLSKLPGCIAVCLNAIIPDATFPNWRAVMPKAPIDSGTSYTGFNAKYLGLFAGVSASGNVGVYAREATAPAWVFTPDEPNFLGVLMPVRFEACPALPAWLEKPAPVAAAAE